jgi:hypothetical protein
MGIKCIGTFGGCPFTFRLGKCLNERCKTEDIVKLTGWAKSAASSAIATDKVTLDEGVYTVTLPKGMKRPAIRQNVQN